MRLNYKRTLLVGFAFFLICVFWQAYDTIVPLMLTNKFGLGQSWSGIIMSLDNILALFLLPLFGTISDKKNSRLGKRTPFILIGTICAIVCFVGLTLVDNAQLTKVREGSAAKYWEENYSVENKEYNSITHRDVDETYSVHEYAARIYFGQNFPESGLDGLSDAQLQELADWYTNQSNDSAKLTYDTVYVYEKATNTYRLVEISEKSSGLFDSTKYVYSDTGEAVADGVLTTNAYSSLVSDAENQFAHTVMKTNAWILVVFVAVLLGALISMATFRSPAVALMPDVTVKPLRSKANAIINLMGTVGGISVLVLGMIFGTGKVKNQMMSYTGFVIAVCAIMAVALAVFLLTVKEKKWNSEMLEAQALLDADETNEGLPAGEKEEAANLSAEEASTAVAADEKLPKDKLKSLILILASVALWFCGYNAITSKYSVYAVNVLNKDYNTTLLIAQAAAVIAYIPVGIVASKIGRKKTILIGVAMLTCAFFGGCFIGPSTAPWIIWILFALAGIAWATINVNSFPMVVELSRGGNIGKYTGYYYTASMAAQVVTPILSGAIMDGMGTMSVLFPYATVFVALSFVTMLFVKHGDAKPGTPQDKLEMLGGADD